MSLVDEVLTGIEGSDCPGAVVAVSENGARSSGARGLAQLGTLEQLGIDTVCYVASVAKQFTAAASLRAAQAGRLTLTDSVGHWVPGLPRWAQELTVEHLLRHTSGLHDYNDILAFGGLEAGSAFGREAVLNQLQRQDRPGFGAGTRYDYSNSNYVLAALIVERATDTDFAAFVAEELFDPLGMGRTTFGAPALGEDRAVGYEPEGESWKVSDAVPGTAGDGGLWSTAADLRTWLQALHGGGVDPQIRAGLLAASLLDGGPALGFGRGIVSGLIEAEPVIYQAGAMAGWRALTLFLPARDCSVVVICNRADVSASEAARTAARKVYSIAPLATLEPRPIPEEMVGWWSDDLIGNVVRFVSRDDGGEFRGSVETVALVGLGGSSARDRDRDVIWRLHGRGNDALLEQVGRGEHRALYRRAEPWRPSSLDAFAGRYASDEAAFSIDVEPAKQPLLVDFGALGRRQAWPTVERCFFGGFPGRLYPIRFSLRFDTHEPAGAAELSVPGAHRILLRRRP